MKLPRGVRITLRPGMMGMMTRATTTAIIFQDILTISQYLYEINAENSKSHC